ncbi:hypothetical protein [Neisseria polysaccharea]|uniref:hypothetical protein n=1 Tax=Neisseria polysaccharea TaxID=489 RepID=UPI00272B1D70|nr:hypothetical protein [Neisseria polysaccharea]
MPSEGSDGIGFGIGTGKGLPVWQSAIGKRKRDFQVCRFHEISRCRVGRAAL